MARNAVHHVALHVRIGVLYDYRIERSLEAHRHIAILAEILTAHRDQPGAHHRARHVPAVLCLEWRLRGRIALVSLDATDRPEELVVDALLVGLGVFV